jgi:curved DNA-binding protein CbpA
MEHIALLYRDIFKKKKSGELLVFDRRVKRTLIFSNGFLCAGWSTLPDEKIGQILLKLKLIDSIHLSALHKISEKKMRFGEYLVSQGLVSRKNLNIALLHQIQRIFLMTFQMEGAQIKFEEKLTALPKEIFQIFLPPLIAKGIRSFFSPSAQRFIQEKDYPFKRDENITFQLEPDEEIIFKEIDGKKSVVDIFLVTGKDRKFVLKTLFLLYCTDSIDFKGEELRKEKEKENIIIEEVEKFYSTLYDKTPLKLFELDKDFTEDELRERYFSIIKKFHPDRVRTLSNPELTKKCEEIFMRLTEAYELLSSPSSKTEEQLLLAKDKPTPEMAEKKFSEAKEFLASGLIWDAILLLKEAVLINSSNPQYYLYLGKAQAKIPSMRKEAEISLLKSIELEKWNPDAFLELGKLYLSEGMKMRAKSMLEKVLVLEPQNEEARELLNNIKL